MSKVKSSEFEAARAAFEMARVEREAAGREVSRIRVENDVRMRSVIAEIEPLMRKDEVVGLAAASEREAAARLAMEEAKSRAFVAMVASDEHQLERIEWRSFTTVRDGKKYEPPLEFKYVRFECHECGGNMEELGSRPMVEDSSVLVDVVEVRKRHIERVMKEMFKGA